MHDEHSGRSLRDMGLNLWNGWTAMWNGQPSLARVLVGPRFALHLAAPADVDPELVDGPEAVERWVASHRARYRSLTFHAECGPFVDVTAGIVAGPWWAEARRDDAERWVCGMDTIAFRKGKITEYWTLSTPVASVGAWTTVQIRDA